MPASMNWKVQVQRMVLGDVADLRQPRRGRRVRGLAEDRHLPFGRLEQPDDHFQEGGPARAVRPHQAGYRAGRHLKRAVARPPHPAVAPAEPVRPQGRNAASGIMLGPAPPCQAGRNVSGSRYDPAMDWKLELVFVPVTDVDRAKAFYVDQVGFNADYDHQVHDNLRFVQLTPPGSACSIAIGTGLVDMAPGSLRNLQVVVDDVAAARKQLIERGVQASDVDLQPWGSFVTFADPDGNTWALQQLPPRQG